MILERRKFSSNTDLLRLYLGFAAIDIVHARIAKSVESKLPAPMHRLKARTIMMIAVAQHR